MSENILLNEVEEDTIRDKYLSFTIGTECYGIEIGSVTEIVGIQPITIVPELPNYIRGIVNLRGQIIPVMDVRLKFKKNLIDYNDRTCVIVVDLQEFTVGLIVDEVSEVLTIEKEKMTPPPKLTKTHNSYINSIGKYKDLVVLIIDCNKLLSSDGHLELLNHLE